MIVVKLGTTDSVHHVRPALGEAAVPVPLPGKRVVTVIIRDEEDLHTRKRTIVHPDGIWPRHSPSWPLWVESNDPELESELAHHYSCPIGRPDDGDEWIESHIYAGFPGIQG